MYLPDRVFQLHNNLPHTEGIVSDNSGHVYIFILTICSCISHFWEISFQNSEHFICLIYCDVVVEMLQSICLIQKIHCMSFLWSLFGHMKYKMMLHSIHRLKYEICLIGTYATFIYYSINYEELMRRYWYQSSEEKSVITYQRLQIEVYRFNVKYLYLVCQHSKSYHLLMIGKSVTINI